MSKHILRYGPSGPLALDVDSLATGDVIGAVGPGQLGTVAGLGNRGPTGPTGPAGATGPTGPAGPVFLGGTFSANAGVPNPQTFAAPGARIPTAGGGHMPVVEPVTLNQQAGDVGWERVIADDVVQMFRQVGVTPIVVTFNYRLIPIT